MTVKELIAILNKYDPSFDVACKWDGGLSDPAPDSITVEEINNVVIIDVSEYGTWHDRTGKE